MSTLKDKRPNCCLVPQLSINISQHTFVEWTLYWRQDYSTNGIVVILEEMVVVIKKMLNVVAEEIINSYFTTTGALSPYCEGKYPLTKAGFCPTWALHCLQYLRSQKREEVQLSPLGSEGMPSCLLLTVGTCDHPSFSYLLWHAVSRYENSFCPHPLLYREPIQLLKQGFSAKNISIYWKPSQESVLNYNGSTTEWEPSVIHQDVL